jgi:hypothetical protein
MTTPAGWANVAHVQQMDGANREYIYDMDGANRKCTSDIDPHPLAWVSRNLRYTPHPSAWVDKRVMLSPVFRTHGGEAVIISSY